MDFTLELSNKVIANGDLETIKKDCKNSAGKLFFKEYGKKKQILDEAEFFKLMWGEGMIINKYKWQIKTDVYKCDVCNCVFSVKGDDLNCDRCGMGTLIKVLDVEVY